VLIAGYRELGCSSAYYHASRHLDLEAHTVAEAIRTGKALAGLLLLAEAYRTGELSPSKAREITRVTGKTGFQGQCMRVSDTAKQERPRFVRKRDKAIAPHPALSPVGSGDFWISSRGEGISG
jgi:hypothetical protein